MLLAQLAWENLVFSTPSWERESFYQQIMVRLVPVPLLRSFGNPDDDPAPVYKAKIIFLQAEEWHTELEQLYQNLKSLAREDEGDDDGADLELQTRIDTAMEKVRAVYPDIENEQDVNKTSVTELINHSNARNLSQELAFAGQNRKKFCSQIRPFIVSSVPGGKFAPWPLVKMAQIYIKSEILKDGLVLVHIPGSMDTNAARKARWPRHIRKSCPLIAFSPRRKEYQATRQPTSLLTKPIRGTCS